MDNKSEIIIKTQIFDLNQIHNCLTKPFKNSVQKCEVLEQRIESFECFQITVKSRFSFRSIQLAIASDTDIQMGDNNNANNGVVDQNDFNSTQFASVLQKVKQMFNNHFMAEKHRLNDRNVRFERRLGSIITQIGPLIFAFWLYKCIFWESLINSLSVILFITALMFVLSDCRSLADQVMSLIPESHKSIKKVKK